MPLFLMPGTPPIQLTSTYIGLTWGAFQPALLLRKQTWQVDFSESNFKNMNDINTNPIILTFPLALSTSHSFSTIYFPSSSKHPFASLSPFSLPL
mmetsp:Transcript_14146/g.30254  ORF Transcript_14146/g.30254 Transcript_14146/m.30254 type:complete len:95 (+) Transcript_14146:153-437(+)